MLAIDLIKNTGGRPSMNLYIFAIITLLVAVLFGFFQYYKLKKSMNEIVQVLMDVDNGNGNRRILSKPRDFLSPVAFHINHTITDYEDQISQLRVKEKTTNQLLTSFSHDIRTPLTVIRAYLDAIKNGTVVGKEKEAYLEVIREKAVALSSYTDSMFEWFKLNSNEYALCFEIVDINELTRNYLVNWIPIFEEREMEYIVDIPEYPSKVLLDKTAYYRIFGNIVQNVISHSHADIVEIRVAEDSEKISVMIKDNGIGIPEESSGHIFERLYKCDPSRRGNGSGLGLSIAYELAQLMKGMVSVESVPNRFTIFKIEFEK